MTLCSTLFHSVPDDLEHVYVCSVHTQKHCVYVAALFLRLYQIWVSAADGPWSAMTPCGTFFHSVPDVLEHLYVCSQHTQKHCVCVTALSLHLYQIMVSGVYLWPAKIQSVVW